MSYPGEPTTPPGVIWARRSRLGVPDQSLRLTRRGRVVVQALLLAALAAVLFGLLGVAPSPGAAADTAGGGRSEVVVRPGDSLWSVAVRHDPSRDPSETIEEIRAINHLPGYTVHPGQTLKLP